MSRGTDVRQGMSAESRTVVDIQNPVVWQTTL